MKTKISIIMPSFNVAPYIEECIKSVMGQTLQDIEIICVDAGSTDGTLDVLKRVESQDLRIHIIHSDKKSYGYQVNIGIKEAKGEYVGIVETDDFIASNMYEELYNIASEYNLDYVKGKYSSFISINKEEKYMWENPGMKEYKEYYNQIVSPCKIPYIYAKDTSVWSGIYKKDFLISNNIWFNESLGAAYQDIGFLMQTIGSAKRAWYYDQSFYRYRIDRDESSVKSPKGLSFARIEFARITSNKYIRNRILSTEGLYTRMLASFLSEFKKVFPMVAFDMDSPFIKDNFNWFVDELRKNNQYSIWNKDKEEFSIILENEKIYLTSFKKKTEEVMRNRNNILNKIRNQEFIIFGAGGRGGVALNYMLSHKCKPVAFCDNDEKKLTALSLEIPVLPLRICKEKFKSPFYIIANKLQSNDIKLQLQKNKIDESEILYFE